MAGKDIFCENPIATDLAETIKAVNLCREQGVRLYRTRLFVSQTRRRYNATLRLKSERSLL